VIDSGHRRDHPDLAGAVIVQYDAVGRNERPHAHGTGMVGAIAARQRHGHRAGCKDSLGARLQLGHRAVAGSDHPQYPAGPEWAIKKGARVINIELPGRTIPCCRSR
jgi:hypothetical protein